MKRLIYGALSSLVIVSTAVPVMAETPVSIVAQTDSDTIIDRMFYEQRILREEIQQMMAQMKAMMAEMKATQAMPAGKNITMNDLYKQQQVLATQVEALVARNRLDTIPPRTTGTATVQEVHQQQQAMISELKTMMAEMKQMVAVYRGRVTDLKQ